MHKILKCCLNPKVLIGIAVIIILLYIFAPHIAQYSWVLLALLCPLSMVVMMAGMSHTKCDAPDEKETGTTGQDQ